MPVPAPTAPSSGGVADPRDAIAACAGGDHVVVLDLHPRGVVEERVVALGDDRDHDVVAHDGLTSSSMRHAAS